MRVEFVFSSRVLQAPCEQVKGGKKHEPILILSSFLRSRLVKKIINSEEDFCNVFVEAAIYDNF